MNDNLKREVSARLEEGQKLLSPSAMRQRFLELGYDLDRSLDCRGVARYMSGPRAGETYPVCTTGVREADTRRSAFHFESRRDDRFRQMQSLRNQVFAVSRGAILEV